MSNHSELLFKLDIHHEDGEWPQHEPYTAANGVRVAWELGE